MSIYLTDKKSHLNGFRLIKVCVGKTTLHTRRWWSRPNSCGWQYNRKSSGNLLLDNLQVTVHKTKFLQVQTRKAEDVFLQSTSYCGRKTTAGALMKLPLCKVKLQPHDNLVFYDTNWLRHLLVQVNTRKHVTTHQLDMFWSDGAEF